MHAGRAPEANIGGPEGGLNSDMRTVRSTVACLIWAAALHLAVFAGEETIPGLDDALVDPAACFLAKSRREPRQISPLSRVAMRHIVTLVANRSATSLSPATIAARARRGQRRDARSPVTG